MIWLLAALRRCVGFQWKPLSPSREHITPYRYLINSSFEVLFQEADSGSVSRHFTVPVFITMLPRCESYYCVGHLSRLQNITTYFLMIQYNVIDVSLLNYMHLTYPCFIFLELIAKTLYNEEQNLGYFYGLFNDAVSGWICDVKWYNI